VGTSYGMAPTMTLSKDDIGEIICKQYDLSKARSIHLIEYMLGYINASLESGEDVLLSGFGKFCVRGKSERRGRNLASGNSAHRTRRGQEGQAHIERGAHPSQETAPYPAGFRETSRDITSERVCMGDQDRGSQSPTENQSRSPIAQRDGNQGGEKEAGGGSRKGKIAGEGREGISQDRACQVAVFIIEPGQFYNPLSSLVIWVNLY
jgi:integration host factor subunit alpha